MERSKKSLNVRMRHGDDREMERTRRKLEPLSSLEPQCDVKGIRRGRN